MKSKIISLFCVVLLFICLFFPANKNYATISCVTMQANDSITQQGDSIQIGDSIKLRVRKSSSYINHYFGNQQRQSRPVRQPGNFASEIDTTKILRMDSVNIKIDNQK